jgi:hypothetical protein
MRLALLAPTPLPHERLRFPLLRNEPSDGVRLQPVHVIAGLVAVTLLMLVAIHFWPAYSGLAAWQPAIRVIRPQNVLFFEEHTSLRRGDHVLVTIGNKVLPATIVGVPPMTTHEHGQMVMLGSARYYVTLPDGFREVVARENIRGLVQSP